LITGIIAAFATPKIVQAMREYRVAAASRSMADLIQKAKMQALSNNMTVALRVDTGNKQMGVVVYDTNKNEVRVDWIPLPSNVTFSMPSGVSAPITGAPTSSAVSFPAKSGQTNVYEQTFSSSRGFPVVSTAGAINAIYFGNGTVYRAVTLTSSGGISTWKWQNSAWVSTRTAN
jgi:Tfp pilus assembly protein FimT